MRGGGLNRGFAVLASFPGLWRLVAYIEVRLHCNLEVNVYVKQEPIKKKNVCLSQTIIWLSFHKNKPKQNDQFIVIQWNLCVRPPYVSDHLPYGALYPRLQNFPSKILLTRTSSKRPPVISDRDHFIGLMVLLFFGFFFNLLYATT